MPLFMDLHKASDYDVKPTVDEIKRNHIADLEVQHKYGVKFLQYWINEEAGLVFCLMEAPDKESCAAVHREAHGAMPCNVIELQGGDYMSFIGDENRVNEFDIVENADGTLDAGYRMILVADFISITTDDLSHEEIDRLIFVAGGRLVHRPGNRKIAVFKPGAGAIECALGIVQFVQSLPGQVSEVRICISAGEPVTEQSEIFADAIMLANRLCDIAGNGEIVVSELGKQLMGESVLKKLMQISSVKVFNSEDEQFLHLLIEAVERLIASSELNIDSLGKHLGMSRSRLYRRVTELTGSSANNLIQELRMQKAFRLIRNNYGNVTQVAFEVGYGNPSYFAKNFQKRFGILPLKAAKLNS